MSARKTTAAVCSFVRLYRCSCLGGPHTKKVMYYVTRDCHLVRDEKLPAGFWDDENTVIGTWEQLHRD